MTKIVPLYCFLALAFTSCPRASSFQSSSSFQQRGQRQQQRIQLPQEEAAAKASTTCRSRNFALHVSTTVPARSTPITNGGDFSTAAAPSPPETAATSTNSDNDTTNNQNKKTKQKKSTPAAAAVDKQRTLYEVLGASPKDTRAELKNKYVLLAKASHPDAVRHTATDDDDDITDFTEVAAAWRILSDPKKRRQYDRTLQAQEISDNIVDFVSTSAAPVTEFSMQALENIALPFLRRTTATTLATVQAAVSSQGTGKKKWQNAVSAYRKADSMVEELELEEKSKTLQERAVETYERAVELQDVAQRKMRERIEASIRTKGAGLTSSEAKLAWEHVQNATTSPLMKNNTATMATNHDDPSSSSSSSSSVWDRVNFRKHDDMEYEINKLELLEEYFLQIQVQDAELQQHFQDTVRDRMKSQATLSDAKKNEERLRLEYLRAQEETRRRELELEGIVEDLATFESAAQKSSYELERHSLELEQQMEVVRVALLKKDEKQKSATQVMEWSLNEECPDMENDSRRILDDVNDGLNNNHIDDNEHVQLLRLERLRGEERNLSEQAQKLEMEAAKFLSRANKLKERAQSLEHQ